MQVNINYLLGSSGKSAAPSLCPASSTYTRGEAHALYGCLLYSDTHTAPAQNNRVSPTRNGNNFTATPSLSSYMGLPCACLSSRPGEKSCCCCKLLCHTVACRQVSRLPNNSTLCYCDVQSLLTSKMVQPTCIKLPMLYGSMQHCYKYQSDDS